MIGTVLGTRYKILSKLGEGAMGQVYLAEHIHLGRREALKVLQPGMALDPQFVSRFRREARATNRVQHPNIVSVYDFGQLPDGRLYLSMEYADGVGLDELLRRLGPLPVPRALPIIAQLASAVEHAHSCGVVHRDLKPPNMILVEHRGHPDVLKVLDFGIAKIIHPEYAESLSLSRDGDVFGTPAYMAPEQLQASTTDPRSDIYAIGCIAFELLVGEPPFRGHNLELMRAHVEQQPPKPSERRPEAAIPDVLDAIIATCLAKNPDLRFQTGRALGDALRHVPGFAAKKSTPRRKSRLMLQVRDDVFDDEETVEKATRSTLPKMMDSVGTADTEFFNLEDMRVELQGAALELAEGILDLGRSNAELALLVTCIRPLLDDLARYDAEEAALEARERSIEQTAREREAPLRFAVGELKFDRDTAAPRIRADLSHQIDALEARIAALVKTATEELEQQTEQRIAVAAARADVEEKLDAAFAALQRHADEILPAYDDELSVAPLIDRYLSIRTALSGR